MRLSRSVCRKALCYALSFGLACITTAGRAQEENNDSSYFYRDGYGQASGSALDRRIQLEQRTRDNPFVITPHRPTYILPFSYNDNPNPDPHGAQQEDIDRAEIKFQFSLKLPLVRNLFGDL